MGYKLMVLFAKRFRSKASQPAVCPLAISDGMESKKSDWSTYGVNEYGV